MLMNACNPASTRNFGVNGHEPRHCRIADDTLARARKQIVVPRKLRGSLPHRKGFVRHGDVKVTCFANIGAAHFGQRPPKARK